jgi:DNA repair exonuclease SbcCD ATPase subunit
MVTEREQSFKQVTETHFQNFRKEIEDLTAHKNKTSNLEKLIDALNKDVDKRKQQLVDTRDTLTKEIQEHRATIRETSDKYTHTRQELFRAHERLRELEHQIATTHVNLTLIQKDVTELILHCWKVSSERALEGWKAASEAAAPHWAKLLEWLKVASYEAVAFYRHNVAPQVEKIMAQSKQQYKQHVQPVIDEKIYPVAKPILDPLREKVLHPAYEKSVHFHGVASVGLGQCSRTLTNYIELTEANESFAGARIYQAFKYTESNSEQVLTNSLWTILGIMVISFLLPRGQKNKLRKEKASKDQC